MSKLFEDSDSETEADIRTNNSYAQNYDNWRQKEELNKFKTKYGEQTFNEFESSTSSSSEDDDDEAVQITEELEKSFFKTLACLKTKDPKIYDENIKFFVENSEINTKKTKKEQPMYIKDYERKLLLEKGGQVEESDEEVDEPKSIAYMEERERKYWKSVVATTDEDNEEWGSLFKTRTKSDAEIKADEEDYKQWLLGQKDDIKDEIKNDLKPLKDYWNDPKLDNNEKFLRDYILNKRFMESENNDYVPTYDEIIHDSDEGLSEDEKQLETQEEFEHKYNYRFEEPDEEFIKRYPRTIESSLRRQDDKRKIKRAEIKERKQKEKERKMEDVRQMQALKKREIAEKINKLKEITGNTEIAFDDNDIDGDFNPEDHDRRMQNLFNEEFYQDQNEEQKPEFPDLDEELGIVNWDKYQPRENCETTNADENYEDEYSNAKLHCEDEDFNMDCDFDPTVSKKTGETSKGKKKRRRKTKFAEIASEPKPIFDPENKTYEQYLDEYYKLECEDIVGDIPCRYKYRKVIPNSFGLSTEEIFTVHDRELNKWCSLKKAVQYRPENVEKYDVIAYSKKGQNESLKRKLLPSLYKKEDDASDAASSKKADALTEEKQEEKGTKNSKRRKLKSKNIKINNEKSGDTNTRIETYSEEEATNKNETLSSIALTKINDSNRKDDIDTTQEKVITNKKKKKKKKKSKSKLTASVSITSPTTNNKPTTSNEANNSSNNVGQDKKRKRINKNHNAALKTKRNSKFSKNNVEVDISDARLKAFGIKPKKFKNKIKYGQKNSKTPS